jgi:hypothetical protein
VSIRLIVGGVLLASLAGNYALYKTYLDKRDELARTELRAEQLDGQLTAMTERYGRAAKVRQVGQQFREAVRSETSSNNWGANVVPGNITGVLCKKANCYTPVDNLPAPSNKSKD